MTGQLGTASKVHVSKRPLGKTAAQTSEIPATQETVHADRVPRLCQSNSEAEQHLLQLAGDVSTAHCLHTA